MMIDRGHERRSGSGEPAAGRPSVPLRQVLGGSGATSLPPGQFGAAAAIAGWVVAFLVLVAGSGALWYLLAVDRGGGGVWLGRPISSDQVGGDGETDLGTRARITVGSIGPDTLPDHTPTDVTTQATAPGQPVSRSGTAASGSATPTSSSAGGLSAAVSAPTSTRPTTSTTRSTTSTTRSTTSTTGSSSGTGSTGSTIDDHGSGGGGSDDSGGGGSDDSGGSSNSGSGSSNSGSGSSNSGSGSSNSGSGSSNSGSGKGGGSDD